MNEKHIILAARIISMVFTPFYLPLVGIIALFLFSYMSQLPTLYKLLILLLVYLFTILIPTMLIHLYRSYHGWQPIQLGVRERRLIPYLISILSYFTGGYVMTRLHVPAFMIQILMAALMIQVVCAIINNWWKISMHAAAIGGLTGGLLAFSTIFMFNPLWPLCLLLIIAGLVGSSRMILLQHTLGQVVTGFLVGLIIGYIFIL